MVELECGVLVLCKAKRTTEKPSEQDENQQQTQPACSTGPKSNPGHIGGIEASALTTAPFLLQTNDSRKQIDISNIARNIKRTAKNGVSWFLNISKQI